MEMHKPAIPHKTARTWRERINDPSSEDLTKLDRLFAQLEELVYKLVENSKTHALFVVGGPGTGKTFVINQILKDMGYCSNRDDLEEFDAMGPKYYEVFSGIVSLSSVIKIAFRHKKEGQIIMFDNADNFLDKTTATDVLKMMLGSGNPRKVSLDKKSFPYADLSKTKDGHSKIPNRFKYEGKMIFVSNRPIDDIDHALLSLVGVDSMEINLTPVEMLLRMKSLIAQETLGDKEVPMHIKHEIFDALIAFMDEVKIDPNDINGLNLSLRNFLQCEKRCLAFPNDDIKTTCVDWFRRHVVQP